MSGLVWLLAAVWFVAGGLLGRWLNRCIERWPHIERVDKSWQTVLEPWTPMGATVPARRLLVGWRWLPVIGWNSLRDVPRSRRRRYARIELVTGLVFAGLYLCEVAAWSTTPLTTSSLFHVAGPLATERAAAYPLLVLHARFLFHSVLIAALVVATWIDLDHRIIPDSITLPGAIVGLAGQFVLGCCAILPVWYQDLRGMTLVEIVAWLQSPEGSPPGIWTWMQQLRGVPTWSINYPHLHGLAVGIVGALVGGGMVWGVRLVGFRALGREAMGFGDVTLLAMIGTFIGWQPCVAVFVVAPMLAAGVAIVQWLTSGQRELPFGPYLAAATVIVLMAGRWVLPTFENLLSFFGPLLPVVLLWLLGMLWAMLVMWRGVQSLLGWQEDDEDGLVMEWTSADQLQFLASEQSDPRQGRWATESWPGVDAGAGLMQEREWRNEA